MLHPSAAAPASLGVISKKLLWLHQTRGLLTSGLIRPLCDS